MLVRLILFLNRVKLTYLFIFIFNDNDLSIILPKHPKSCFGRIRVAVWQIFKTIALSIKTKCNNDTKNVSILVRHNVVGGSY